MKKDKCLKICLEWLLKETCPDLTRHFGGYTKAALLVFLYNKGYTIAKDGTYNRDFGKIEIYRCNNNTSTHAIATRRGRRINPYGTELGELVETICLRRLEEEEEIEIVIRP